MVKMLLVAGVLVMSATLAAAQVGSIGLFANAAGTDCNIRDTTAGLCSVYVVHVSAPGVTASEWAISSPACILATFLSDSSPFGVYIGASPFNPGKSVGYGVCLVSPIHVATLSYFCQALTPVCCLQSVIPHLINGGPSAVDCAAVKHTATGGATYWNSDNTCDCEPGIRAATWGEIKATYE